MGDQSLRVLVDEVVTSAAAVLARVDVCVVAVDEDVGRSFFEGLWKQLCGPEKAILAGPCVPRLAVEAVDEDDVDLGVRVGEDARNLEAGDL